MSDEQIQAIKEVWDAIVDIVREFLSQFSAWVNALPRHILRAIEGRAYSPMRKKIRRYLAYSMAR